MSTVVAVNKGGVVAVGADTLSTFGYTKESVQYLHNPSKITPLGENYFATVGNASWSLVLSSYWESLKNVPTLDSPQAIFEFARKMHVALIAEYYLNPHERDRDEFQTSQLNCLIANPHGIFGLYAHRSVMEYARFYAFGSGREYALGAMWAVYDTDASAEEIARLGAAAGAEFDEGSGLPVEVHTLRLKQ